MKKDNECRNRIFKGLEVPPLGSPPDRYPGNTCLLVNRLMELGPDIPMDWCYCSGGFGKLMFDIVFGESTEVEVLQSVLAGDTACRFRIKLPEKMIPDNVSSISS